MTQLSVPMNMQLTPDEIRTATMIVNQFRSAMARVQMAQEMEAQYMEQLRAKYNLGPEWVCNDLLDGFVTAEGSHHDQDI